MRNFKALVLIAGLFAAATMLDAQSITRERVMQNANAYCNLGWTMNTRNTKNACPGSGVYIRTPFANSSVVGMPYNWGGMNTIAEYQNGIAGNGFAGNRCTDTEGNCCLRPNTFGVDCSGLVQRVWEYPPPKLGTSALQNISSTIRLGNAGMRSGDIFLLGGSHTVLLSHVDQSGNPWVIEASATDWKVTLRQRSWSSYSSYQKRRYLRLQDGGIGKIDQGVTVSNRPRANQSFSAAFRIRETDGASITYDDVTVAILDQSGRYKFDLQHRGSTQVSADGSVSVSVTGIASLSPGTYVAVARGKIGSTWSDFLATSGHNSVAFTVER